MHLLTGKSAAKPASVNDSVAEGQAVRTGGESRAELTFTDRSITRLGANTVFTYGEGAKVLDLTSGAALIVVPKESGTIRVNTAATTAAVTGFVALVESHATAPTKWMIMAGHACVKRRGKGHEPCVTLGPGDMLIIQPGTRGNGIVEKFDIQKAIGSALLITDFGKLPKWALDDIQEGIDGAAEMEAPRAVTRIRPVTMRSIRRPRPILRVLASYLHRDHRRPILVPGLTKALSPSLTLPGGKALPLPHPTLL